MKKRLLYFVLGAILTITVSCGTSKSVDISPEEKALFAASETDSVQINEDETTYDIIIIDPGFNSWLNSFARPKGYYSQSFFENRNAIMVQEWNRRVQQPTQYDPNLYELRIDYEPSIDYGYDVNYQLYNYFIYFQRKYKQRLSSYLPRI